MPADRPLNLTCLLRVALVAVLTLGLAAPVTTLLDQRVAAAATADQVLAEAAKHAGKPYRYGATGPGSFDCSGFTSYVFRQVGISLPRTSGAQRAALPSVPNDQKVPGDLIFTHDSSGRIYHVGIYAGNGMIWHSPRTGDVVKHSRIFGSYSVGRTALSAPAPATPIQAHWDASPAIRAALGAATTPEFAVHGGTVRNHSNGQIVHSRATGAKAVQGAIEDAYGRLRWEQGPLGFPVTDELPVPGGRQSVFQHGVIVWSPDSGAQLVHGAVRLHFEALGGVSGVLGFPTSDRRPVPGGVSQAFQRGEMFVDADRRTATALTGAVLDTYHAAGGPAGQLGMPVAVEQGGAVVRFEGGEITYDRARGVAAVAG